MNYLTQPPEVTSTLIYSGPGSSPMTAAASAWSTLAADLKTVAGTCESVIRQLTGEGWLGSASASMAAAVTPYLTWMKVTAEQAEQAAAQARAAAAAYETAHALTVPPVAVATNRIQLQQLVATNIIGQNTAAIASTEIEHGEMWAQDTIAMQGYHAQSAAATTLTPFSNPPNPTDPSGEAAQNAAVGNAAGNATAAQTQTATASHALQSLLARSAEPDVPYNPADDILKDPGYQLGNQTMSQLTSQANLQSNNMCAVWRGLSGVTGTQKLMTEMAKDAAKAAGSAAAPAAAGAAQGAAGAAQGLGGAAGGLGAVAGGMGRAGALGAMSVPPTWVAPTPPPVTLGPVSGGSWQPVGPGILGSTPMAPPPGMPGVPGAAAAGAGFRGFSAPRYGVAPTVMPKNVVGG